MAIEIYAVEPGDTQAKRVTTQSLYAVAPLEQCERVALWCDLRNVEAIEAGVTRRFGYNITAVEIWT